MKLAAKIAAGFVLAMAILAILTWLHARGPSPAALLTFIRSTPWPSLAYMLVYIAAAGLGYPATALTIIAGPLFGLWRGLLYVVIASNTSALLSFAIARRFGAGLVERLLPANSPMEKLLATLNKNGFAAIFLLRLFPVFHFALFNYTAGLTGIKFSHYALATILGRMPGLVVFIWFSTTLVEIQTRQLVAAALTLAFFVLAGQLVRKKVIPRLE